MVHHNGYEAVVAFDEEAEILHGEVINLRDVITFQARLVDELKEALAESVEDDLAFCAERGEEPEKPFSGQFVVRAEPQLHRAQSTAARRAGVSLNKFVTTVLERPLAHYRLSPQWSRASEPAVPRSGPAVHRRHIPVPRRS